MNRPWETCDDIFGASLLALPGCIRRVFWNGEVVGSDLSITTVSEGARGHHVKERSICDFRSYLAAFCDR